MSMPPQGQPPVPPQGQPPVPSQGQPAPNFYGYPQQVHPSAPQFGVPAANYGMPVQLAPGSRKKSALPWIVGGGLAAVAVLAVVLVLILGMLGKSGMDPMSAAQTKTASFSYPDSWNVVDTSNVTVISPDGSTPAERFVARKGDKPKTALLVYEAAERPASPASREKISKAVDTGLRLQLELSQAKLVELRSTAGFGCASDFSYTNKPVIVDNDGFYGYSYGYTCTSFTGPIQGEYLVGFDNAGVAHRLTVEALSAEWSAHKKSMEAIIGSFVPTV